MKLRFKLLLRFWKLKVLQVQISFRK